MKKAFIGVLLLTLLASCSEKQLNTTPTPDIRLNPIKIEGDVMTSFPEATLSVERNNSITFVENGEIALLISLDISAVRENKEIVLYVMERDENGNKLFMLTTFNTTLNKPYSIYVKKRFSELNIVPKTQNKYYLLLKSL